MTGMKTNDEGHRRFTLHDGEREVQFTGVLLGEASSFRRGKSRWSEIKIFRTRGGNYIVAGVGRSTVPNESDRFWTQVCERPHGVIEKLHMLDEDGARYIPHTSREALEQSTLNDEELRSAYRVEVVD